MKAEKVLKGICALSLAGALAFVDVGAYATPTAVEAASYNTNGGIATLGSGTASITINGNVGQTLIGKSFNVYKLFNAENSKKGESINYTFNPAYEQAIKNVVATNLSKNGTTVTEAEVTEYMAIDYIQSLNTHQVEGATAKQTLESRYSLFRYFVEDLRDEMVRLGMEPDVVNVKNVSSSNSFKIAGLDYGYYIVDEVTNAQDTYSAASLCMVDTANPTSTISIKSDYPSINIDDEQFKMIQEDDAWEGITDDENWNAFGDYEIGQTVPYRFKSNIPDINGYDEYYYAWHDTMSDALTFQKDSVNIEISNGTKSYTLKSSEYTINEKPGDGETFVVAISDIKAIVDREFPDFDSDGHNTYGQIVTMTYDAVMNDKAAQSTGRPGFENEAYLEYSNDSDSDGSGETGKSPSETVVCFTYQLDVLKTNNHDLALEGAKFRLYSDADCKNEVYVKSGNGSYIVVNRDSVGGDDHTGGSAPSTAVEMTSSEDGSFVIYGLDSGTYYLKETDAPDGYRLLQDPIEIKIEPTYASDRSSYVKGDGATSSTLQELDASAKIKSFYNGVFNTDNETLEADPADGTINLTVVNQVGMKLPITGTSVAIMIVIAGAALMVVAIVRSRKGNFAEK